jgi:hypothetical protein
LAVLGGTNTWTRNRLFAEEELICISRRTGTLGRNIQGGSDKSGIFFFILLNGTT